jgi:hypothetical protein
MTTEKPSKSEEEYFARQEFERRRKEMEKEQARLKGAERERLKQLHYMRCPKCGMELVEIEFKTIKVDRCVACEGIWFDGGEVERLLEHGVGILGKLSKIFS